MAYQVSGQRLSDRAYSEVKALVVSGELAPGALIAERDLTAQLGIGRTPLREALQRLVHEHFLSVVPGGGYLVTPISPDDIRHIYELRRPVESLSARLAATRATSRDVERLKEFIVEAEASAEIADGSWHLSVDQRFHDLVAAATGNVYLRSTVNELFGLTQRILVACRPSVPAVADELPFYRELTDLIEKHDADGAEKAMSEHVTESAAGNRMSLD